MQYAPNGILAIEIEKVEKLYTKEPNRERRKGQKNLLTFPCIECETCDGIGLRQATGMACVLCVLFNGGKCSKNRNKEKHSRAHTKHTKKRLNSGFSKVEQRECTKYRK